MTLLQLFSRDPEHQKFCLAHLFTDQMLEGGVLGLAYVGNGRRGYAGGICSAGDLQFFRLKWLTDLTLCRIHARREKSVFKHWFDECAKPVRTDRDNSRNGTGHCSRTGPQLGQPARPGDEGMHSRFAGGRTIPHVYVFRYRFGIKQ